VPASIVPQTRPVFSARLLKRMYVNDERRPGYHWLTGKHSYLVLYSLTDYTLTATNINNQREWRTISEPVFVAKVGSATYLPFLPSYRPQHLPWQCTWRISHKYLPSLLPSSLIVLSQTFNVRGDQVFTYFCNSCMGEKPLHPSHNFLEFIH
jgi:hypothetical protein